MKAGRSRVPPARPFDTAPLRRIPTLMTYCVGLKMRAGLVMLSDTRTNAGVDNISTYRKTTLWGRPGKSVLCLTAAGNLAITQAVVNRLRRGLEDGRHLDDAPDMVSAAELWASRSGPSTVPTARRWKPMTPHSTSPSCSAVRSGAANSAFTKSLSRCSGRVESCL